jgi:hypothetical protein
MPKYSAIPTSDIFVYYEGLVIKEIEKKVRETETRKRRRRKNLDAKEIPKLAAKIK